MFWTVTGAASSRAGDAPQLLLLISEKNEEAARYCTWVLYPGICFGFIVHLIDRMLKKPGYPATRVLLQYLVCYLI